MGQMEERAAQTGLNIRSGNATACWVFVCNPQKWAIDRFLERGIENDTWGIRPSDRNAVAPGQLGILRVGVDRRSVAERNGRPPLVPGIYALCEVESEAFIGTGAADEFWSPENKRPPGWPTVKIRYLRVYRDHPLAINEIRAARPNASKLLLNGFQASTFPLSADDFHAVIELLGEYPDDLPAGLMQRDLTANKLADLEKKYLFASPEVKARLSRTVERGAVGSVLKRLMAFKCQLCAALGSNSLGFLKPNGENYVEAHHVMPVSKGQIGTLGASNIMILCANHHRQMHYGNVEVIIRDSTFEIGIDRKHVTIRRAAVYEV